MEYPLVAILFGLTVTPVALLLGVLLGGWPEPQAVPVRVSSGDGQSRDRCN